MRIIDRIEQRVTLPGDSETRRSQKVLGTVITFVGVPFSAGLAIANYANGLTGSGYLLTVWAMLLLISGLLMLGFPRQWRPIVSATIFLLVPISLANSVLAGGFQSGTETAPWMLLGPLVALFLIGQRYALFMLVVYFLGVIVAAFLEPFAQSIAPDVTLAARMQIATSGLIVLGTIAVSMGMYLLHQVEKYRRRADDLLLNILPDSIAARLKENPQSIADGFDDVTVLFADIVDFTEMSSNADPVHVVNFLNEIFSEFDDLAEKYGLEKIKTIGDAYMIAAGLPEARADHAEAVAAFALDMLAILKHRKGLNGQPIRLRVGMNSGPVVAGVIGRRKFIYDLWGDAVNVASRMESNGLSNQIQVTEAVRNKLKEQYSFTERPPIEVKGKGTMVTYLLTAD